MSDKPPVPTSGRRVFKDISETDEATHVYVKVANPLALQPKWEGPYKILSRPSRSTVEVKIGMFRNGEVRKSVYHWTSCKVAYLRQDQPEAHRPPLGRRPKEPSSFSPSTSVSEPASNDTDNVYFSYGGVPPSAPPTGRVSAPNSNDVSLLDESENEPNVSEEVTSRPVRITRNPHPNYKT